LQECDCTFDVFSFGFCLVNKILGEDFYFSNIKFSNWQLGLINGRSIRISTKISLHII